MNEPTIQDLLCENARLSSLLHELRERYDTLKLDHRKLLDGYRFLRLMCTLPPDKDAEALAEQYRSAHEPDFKSQLE